MATMDRFGRRPLMLLGLSAMALSAGALASTYTGGDRAGLAAVLLCVFITAGALGPAPVFWVYICEIYPQPVRGAMMSLATAAHWAADFVVAMTFLPLARALGFRGAFLCYAAVTALALVTLARTMSETRGRRLEELTVVVAPIDVPGGTA
jgi:MFS family permease